MNDYALFENGFPDAQADSFRKVISAIGTETVGGVPIRASNGYDSENEYYYLSNGETVRFPYRVYLCRDDSVYERLTGEEKRIYDCVFTRSCDGFAREKHLCRLLRNELPEWCMPYVLRLSAEYVIEIIEIIYRGLLPEDHTGIQAFCLRNPAILKRFYQRMVSYWNVFYRAQYPCFFDYIGCKLFKEIFAPHVNFEKL